MLMLQCNGEPRMLQLSVPGGGLAASGEGDLGLKGKRKAAPRHRSGRAGAAPMHTLLPSAPRRPATPRPAPPRTAPPTAHPHYDPSAPFSRRRPPPPFSHRRPPPSRGGGGGGYKFRLPRRCGRRGRRRASRPGSLLFQACFDRAQSCQLLNVQMLNLDVACAISYDNGGCGLR